MPGYIIHLAEAKMVADELEARYGLILSADWRRRFYLGTLLPDTKKKRAKERSHYWNRREVDEDLLALAPDVSRFVEEADDGVRIDPGFLGYWLHLDLDRKYVKDYWVRHWEFQDGAGVPCEIRSKIEQVYLYRDQSTVAIDDFFSDRYYYGDYSRMNHWIVDRFGVEIPTLDPSDFEESYGDDVSPEDLKQVLDELDILMRSSHIDGEMRVFSQEEVADYIGKTADEAASMLADRVYKAPAEERVRVGSERIVDLHAHTTASDGSLTPTELVQLAADRGLAAVAVTDHDTMDGVREAIEAGLFYGVEVVPGIEFSTAVDDRDVHMVALLADPFDDRLQAVIRKGNERRRARNRKIAQNLMDAGFDLTWDDIAGLGDGMWTRGNLAELLVRKGYAETVSDAMHRYLYPGTVGYEPKITLRPEELVDVVHRAGGLLMVAHFHQIYRNDPERSLRVAEDLLRAGADGLETRYCEFNAELQKMAEGLVEQYGCLRSGGSDFHGRIKPGLELGSGYGKLRVPESYLVELQRRSGRR